jgi:hypothetical protein
MAFNLSDFQAKMSTMANVEKVATDYIQYLQPKGFFLAEEFAQNINFKPDSQWKPYNHTFGSATSETPGYISQQPRLLVLNQSPLYVVSKETGAIIGEFNKATYNKMLHGLKMRYIVLPVSAKGEPLSDKPIIFTTRGVFQYTFSKTYNKFKTECQAILKKLSGNTYALKSEIYSYFVFKPVIITELNEYKKMTGRVMSFEPINEENIESMLLMSNEKITQLVKEGAEMDCSLTVSSESNQGYEEESKAPVSEAQKSSLSMFANKFAGDVSEAEDSFNEDIAF